MGIGVFLKGAIDKVLGSKMHPVAKGAIVVLLFVGLGAATYFGIA
ncbi:hypothetical protein ACV1C6_11130 [Aeromonas sanarellii]